MLGKRKELETKIQAVCCGLLITLMGLGVLVNSYPAERQVWSIETVDSIGFVGSFPSIALDTNGYPHISYLDFTNGDLEYAYWDGGGWHYVTVDSAGMVGWWTSLALDTNGYPHISYQDNTNTALKYAYKNESGWHTVMVDNLGNVGYSTSLALDTSNYPHISYYDTTNDDLKYAYRDGGGWHIVTVDSTGNVGTYTSLALDTSDYPHFSYTDSTNARVKYAYRDGGGWHTETVDSTATIGWLVSLDLDTSNYPHISYYDPDPNYDLEYAYKDSGGWHTITVDSTGDVGGDTSLSLDSSGYPHISYQDSTNAALKYAYQDGGGWHIVTVDNNGDYYGGHTSLALDTNGYPHISYHDWANGDLKYAYRADTTPPVIDNVHAAPSIQIPGGEVTVGCTVTDNLGVGDVKVNITYPDSSTVNVSMSPRGDYSYSATYSQLGTYTYFIWANDTSGNTATSTPYQFTIATTDYLQITYHAQNEIPDTTISTHFSLDSYAGAFNDTHGFITFVDATWGIQNNGGSNASVNTTSGESVEFFSGWFDGTATVTVDDGSGHSDTVVFTVDSSAHCLLLYPGWNLIGWWGDTTTAESLGENISGCTVVTKLDGETQNFTSHVVGIPHDNFSITWGMGLFIYTTEASIWHGEG